MAEAAWVFDHRTLAWHHPAWDIRVYVHQVFYLPEESSQP